MVELLLSLNADINLIHGPGGRFVSGVPIRGFAPIHFAIINKDIEMVKFLIANNANLEIRTNGSISKPFWCPIHFAVDSGVIEIVNILVTCGVDVNAKMNRGDDETRPLYMAINRKKRGEDFDEIISILESAGAVLFIFNH